MKFASQGLILAIFFYGNTFLLIPAFLKKGKPGIYFLYVLICIVLIFFYYQAVDNFFQQDYKQLQDAAQSGASPFKMARKTYGPIFSAIFIFGISTSITITSEWFKNEKRRKEMENEKLISELSFLKSQVSPHFLFNTLNNIYSLSLSNSGQTSEAVLKLSHLLRYMLYESQDKLVSIRKEVDYLQNYIELQKIRLTREVEILFEVKGDFGSRMIEPMLLIPFVENAFKHGVNYSEKSFVHILLEVTEKKLHFRVENSSFPKNKEKKENSGIGLVNVEKRLDLLYPGDYALKIEPAGNKFTVDLTMNLHV